MDNFPKMKCRPNCSDCCGLVPFTIHEAKAAQSMHPLRNLQWVPAGEAAPGRYFEKSALDTLTCPFVKDHKCTVYDTRPNVCRAFGVVDHRIMQCPHGCGSHYKLPNNKARPIVEKCAVSEFAA